jgi:hypothetical protein
MQPSLPDPAFPHTLRASATAVGAKAAAAAESANSDLTLVHCKGGALMPLLSHVCAAYSRSSCCADARCEQFAG